jgi:hypothetical protein
VVFPLTVRLPVVVWLPDNETAPAKVTAWLASMAIAVVPAVWMFNTPLVSAVVTTPAVVDALIDEANLFS